MSRIAEVAWIIEHSKIREYLLNPNHPRGASKAKFLMGFGFTPTMPDQLANALVEHGMTHWPGRTDQPKQGPDRIVFEGMVRAPDGRDMPLRTVWLPREEPPEMRFVTAVPLTR